MKKSTLYLMITSLMVCEANAVMDVDALSNELDTTPAGSYRTTTVVKADGSTVVTESSQTASGISSNTTTTQSNGSSSTSSINLPAVSANATTSTATPTQRTSILDRADAAEQESSSLKAGNYRETTVTNTDGSRTVTTSSQTVGENTPVSSTSTTQNTDSSATTIPEAQNTNTNATRTPLTWETMSTEQKDAFIEKHHIGAVSSGKSTEEIQAMKDAAEKEFEGDLTTNTQKPSINTEKNDSKALTEASPKSEVLLKKEADDHKKQLEDIAKKEKEAEAKAKKEIEGKTPEELEAAEGDVLIREPDFASGMKTMHEPLYTPDIADIIKTFRKPTQGKYFMPFDAAFDRNVKEILKVNDFQDQNNRYKTVHTAMPSINFKPTAGTYKPFGFGCDGITYNGALEQIPIDYLTTIRNGFTKVTNRYVDCGAEGSDAKLVQQADLFANAMCAVEILEYSINGSIDGFQVIGTDLKKAFSNCASILSGLVKTEIAGNINNTALLILGGKASIDISKVPEYLACVDKEISDMDILGLWDSCYDRRFNDFMDFMNELFNMEFSVNIGVKGIQAKACSYELEKNGNIFESINGKWDILSSLTATADAPPVPELENLNGVLINREKKTYSIGQDLTEFETSAQLQSDDLLALLETYIKTAYLSTAPEISEKPKCITDQADEFYDTIVKEINSAGGDYLDVSALISYINEPIHLVTELSPTPVGIPFVVANTCKNPEDIMMSRQLHLRLQSALIKFLNLYFLVLDNSAIIKAKHHADVAKKAEAASPKSSAPALSETNTPDVFDIVYLGNDTTGVLNARIEEFNMIKVKERSAQFKRAVITKSLFFTSNFSKKPPFKTTWSSECTGD